MNIDQINKIARLNDVFRMQGSSANLTKGVYELDSWMSLLLAVRNYDNFNEDNDPYGEHDFGTLDWYGRKIFWKIDYYDERLEKWCDPLSPDCHRVLTVMLAEEY